MGLTGIGSVAGSDDVSAELVAVLALATGAAQKSANLSDLASASASRTSLGLGTAAVMSPAQIAADSALTGTYAAIAAPSVGAVTLPRMPWPVDPATATVVTGFQSGHGFTASGADSSNVNDTTAGLAVVGTQCATITSNGAGASAVLAKTSVTTMDTTKLSAMVLVKCDDATHLSSMKLSIGNGGSFTNSQEVNFGNIGSVPSGVWAWVSVSFADAVSQGSPTRTSVNAVRVYFKDDNTGNKVTVHWGAIVFYPSAAYLPGAPYPNGVASISFDDGYASTWTLGKPYLEARGIRASAYIIRDVLGVSGRLTLAQVKSLQDQAGWEVALHANTDADHSARFTSLSASELLGDITAEKQYLLANGLDAQGIAYPGGVSNGDVVETVKLFSRYGRNTVPLCETWPPADPYRIKSFSSISTFSGGISPSSIYTATTGKIDKAVAEGAWINLVFHNIVTHGTTLTAATDLDYNDFTAIIDKLVSSGITILPVGEVVNTRGRIGYSSAAAVDSSAAAPTAGVAATVARSDHAHPRTTFAPSDHGWLSWTYDPSLAVNATILATGGTVYVAKLHLPTAASITNVILSLTTIGGTLTSGQCFAGVYQNGSLLGATADQASTWQGTTGVKTMAISGGPVAAAAGDIYVAFFANGSTLPTFSRGAGQAVINGGLSAATSRYASADTSRTTSLPTTLGSLTALSVAYWAAIS